MATVLKRLLMPVLALAFVVGVTAQLMPSSMAAPDMTVSAEGAAVASGITGRER